MIKKVLARYNSEEAAKSYRAAYREKFQRKLSDRCERRLLGRIFARTGHVASLLDLPCGFGRLRTLFQTHATKVLSADWSSSMLRENLSLQGSVDRTACLRANALEIPIADRAVDCVVSIRLNHHIDGAEEREQHLRELMRVARRYVVFSYYSYHSLKNLWRRVRRPFNRKRAKYTLRTSCVVALAVEAGYELGMASALSWFGSGHVFALLERRDGGLV